MRWTNGALAAAVALCSFIVLYRFFGMLAVILMCILFPGLAAA